MNREPSRSRPAGDAYHRLVRHERSLWLTTIAIVVMSGLTVAVLTVGAAVAGAFDDPSRGYLLAGAIFFILAGFIAYVGHQRSMLEETREQILRENQARTAALHETNRSLQEALRTRDQLLDNVSHELKTPLTCMLASAEFIVDGDEPQRAAGHARTILEEGRGLVELIDGLMDLARFRSGTLSLERRSVDLLTVLQPVLDDFLKRAAQREVALMTEFGDGPLRAWVDPGRVAQVVGTLLGDAVGQTPAGGTVFLRAYGVGEDWIEVVVEDRSTRRAAEEREALFRPFGQIEPAPEGRSGDLGLALPLARRLVLAHGGWMDLSPAHPRGLRFTLRLPREAAALEDPAPGDAAGAEAA